MLCGVSASVPAGKGFERCIMKKYPMKGIKENTLFMLFRSNIDMYTTVDCSSSSYMRGARLG